SCASPTSRSTTSLLSSPDRHPIIAHPEHWPSCCRRPRSGEQPIDERSEAFPAAPSCEHPSRARQGPCAAHPPLAPFAECKALLVPRWSLELEKALCWGPRPYGLVAVLPPDPRARRRSCALPPLRKLQTEFVAVLAFLPKLTMR